MPSLRLTKTAIEKLPFSDKQTFFFDTRLIGFGIRVSTNTKTYIVQCLIKGQKNHKGKPLEIRHSIGRVGILSFEEAQEVAERILQDAVKGISPDDREREAQRAKRAQEAQEDITINTVLPLYVAARKKLKATTADEYKMRLKIHLSDWLDIPMDEIDGNMVVKRHEEIGKVSHAQADNIFRILRALFNFAMILHEDRILKNPVKKLSAFSAWYKVGRRKGYVAPGDLEEWFGKVESIGNPATRDMIKILLFTGARKVEIGQLKWKDVDLENGIIRMKTKTLEELEIPVCKYVVDVLKARQELTDKGPDTFIFPSCSKKRGHLYDIRESMKTAKLDRIPHDLRRSFQSYCELLRIPVFTIKRLVGHALPKDVTEGYIQWHMEDLRRDVEAVASFILRSAGIEESNVVQMRRMEK